MPIHAYAARAAGAPLEPFDYEPGPLGPRDVEVAVSHCGICDFCIAGDEPFCAANQATCVGHFGGYADRLRVDGRFAFHIPPPLSSEQAAPLLCGGATVHTPLRHFGVRPDHRVGVVSIGGLGHLAVQFARAFGCARCSPSWPAKGSPAVPKPCR